MGRLSLGDILSFFPANELSQALARGGLRGGGTKIERLEALRAAAVQDGASPQDVFHLFSAEALRRLATRFGIQGTTKDQYVAGLCAALTEPFPPPKLSVAPTIDAIRDFLRTLAGSYRPILDEADAEWFVASALADHFRDVHTQQPVPGHFGHRIDIDIQSGSFGVEVKLASAIVDNSSEAYRLLGQALYYDRRRYARRLLVVIVGPPELENHPIIGEVVDLLGVIGVVGTYLPVHAS